MVVSDAVTANAHHGLAAHEVVLLLQTDPHRGLTHGVAAERLKEFGLNTLPAPRGAASLETPAATGAVRRTPG